MRHCGRAASGKSESESCDEDSGHVLLNSRRCLQKEGKEAMVWYLLHEALKPPRRVIEIDPMACRHVHGILFYEGNPLRDALVARTRTELEYKLRLLSQFKRAAASKAQQEADSFEAWHQQVLHGDPRKRDAADRAQDVTVALRKRA